MIDQTHNLSRNPQGEEMGEGLRQALLRLTSSHYVMLQEEIEELRRQISAFEAVWERIENVQDNLSHRDEELNQQDQDLKALAEEAKAKINQLETGFQDLNNSLGEGLNANAILFESELASLRALLDNPQEVSKRVGPVLIPLISEGVRQKQDEFAEAVAPVIGPAIRYQIRDAKQDIIDALYPMIGEIIGKAISEAIRELTRKIDTRLRQQLNFRSRLRLYLARLRGISEAELLMREALPYTIHHIFLIHRQSGLLLKHIPVSDERAQDTDLISGMLTAIRDFVRESFGRGKEDLEEVAYGQQRILLEGGQYAYVAVVLEGVEPEGYSQLMRDVIGDIHLYADNTLRVFDGQMDDLPDFQKALSPLAMPAVEGYELVAHQEPLRRTEKLFLFGGSIASLIVLGLLIFGCIFTTRLWPVAFPGPSSTPTATTTPLPDPISTATPTLTLTSTRTPTTAPMSTFIPSPTNTVTQNPTVTSAPLIATLVGNSYLRSGPSTTYSSLRVLIEGEQVTIMERRGEWLHVLWPALGEPQFDGWVWSGMVVEENIP